MADGAPDLEARSSVFRVRVHSEGGEQFIVLPDALRMEADEVSLRREGDSVVLAPVTPGAAPETDAEWVTFWAEIDIIRGDDRLAQPEREGLDETEAA